MTEGPRSRWILRLILPAVIVVLLSALYDIWSDRRYSVRWADIVGSFGLLVCLFGVVLWCFTAWTARPTRLQVTGGEPAEPAARRAGSPMR